MVGVGAANDVIFFCKQKTAYEVRISDWSSDVCSSDLLRRNEGSNPSLSASSCAPPQILGFGRRCRFGKVDFMSQMLVPVSFGELLDKIAIFRSRPSASMNQPS